MNDDLSFTAPNLTLNPEGYWEAHSDDPVSYPKDGHQEYFTVEDGSFWFRHRNSVITDVVRLFPPGGWIFDIGGGNGYVAMGLEAAGFPCVVVEPGRGGATNALGRGVKTVVRSTLESADFRQASLGAVGLFDVLEHIEDDHAFLKKIHSLLRPDGRIYLTVPAFQTLWSTEDENAGHHRRYSKRALTASLRDAGFVVEYVSYFFWFLVFPVLAFRTIPSRLGFWRSKSAERAGREHSAGSGLFNQLVGRALDAERARMGKKSLVPFGGSCVAVARRSDLGSST